MAPSRGSTPCSRRTDGGEEVRAARQAPGCGDVPARLAPGALRAPRPPSLLPLPQGPGRHELVAHARLGHADGVPRPARDRRDPGDVLQALAVRGALLG